MLISIIHMSFFDNVSIEIRPKREIDTAYSSSENEMTQEPQGINYETLYKTYKKCPEFVNVITAIVTDIMSDGFDLISDSKSKVNKMYDHLEAIDFYKKWKTFLTHAFITGDGYCELRVITKDKMKNILADAYKEATNMDITKTFTDAFLSKAKREYNVTNYPFDVFPIKTTGMFKIVDAEGNTEAYQQEVNGRTLTFSKNDIIYWTPFDIGEVYGFSPAQSLLDDFATLLFAKQWAGQFFENGGTPDSIFILKNARGLQDRNYEVAKHEIKQAREKKHWHKTMIMTGEVEHIKVNDFNKDYEFGKLIDMETQRIAMSFGVPPSKVPYMSGSKGDFREMNEGYWKLINAYQTELEELWNRVIFSNYGMSAKFKRSYKIDELREAQIISFLRDRDIITEEEARNRIGYYSDKDKGTENPDPKPKIPAQDGQYRDMGNRQDARGQGQDVGARLTRSLKKGFADAVEIAFDNFESIVRQKFPSLMAAKIIYKEMEDRFELYYFDGANHYKTVIMKDDIEDLEGWKAIYLIGAVRWL